MQGEQTGQTGQENNLLKSGISKKKNPSLSRENERSPQELMYQTLQCSQKCRFCACRGEFLPRVAEPGCWGCSQLLLAALPSPGAGVKGLGSAAFPLSSQGVTWCPAAPPGPHIPLFPGSLVVAGTNSRVSSLSQGVVALGEGIPAARSVTEPPQRLLCRRSLPNLLGTQKFHLFLCPDSCR